MANCDKNQENILSFLSCTLILQAYSIHYFNYNFQFTYSNTDNLSFIFCSKFSNAFFYYSRSLFKGSDFINLNFFIFYVILYLSIIDLRLVIWLDITLMLKLLINNFFWDWRISIESRMNISYNTQQVWAFLKNVPLFKLWNLNNFSYWINITMNNSGKDNKIRSLTGKLFWTINSYVKWIFADN